MKIVIVSIEEPIYATEYLKYLLKHLHEQVCKTYIVKPPVKGWRKRLHQIVYRVLLAAVLYPFKDILHLMKSCLAARLKGKKSPFDLVQWMDSYHIPVSVIHSVNSKTFQADLRRIGPDFVVNRSPMKVGKESLEIPKIGWINNHFGLLPDYRGAFPMLWAYWNREPEMGATVHLMNENYDEGEILGQITETIRKGDSLPLVLKRLNAKAARLMVDCLKSGPPKRSGMGRQSRYFKNPSIGLLLKHLLFKN